MRTERVYMVTVSTNAPEHKLSGVDQTVARQMYLGFGDIARVWVLTGVEEGKRSLRTDIGTVEVKYDP